NDSQVKIRGFRIELGEIEVALSQYPIISQTVVSVEEEGDNKQLVAYLILEKEKSLTIDELRAYLKKQLPEYMIPSSYVVMESFPLTPNGKVDRKALSASEHNRLKVSDNYIAPRSPIEEMLIGIWCNILQIEKIGVNDNFFELGGHSLLAIKAILQIQRCFDIELSVRNIFEFPTIASLSEKVLNSNNRVSKQATSIVKADRSKSLPLSFAQQRLWFLAQFEPNSSLYNTYRTILLRGTINIIALEKNINEIIKRHESLRTRFSTFLDQPVQIIEDDLYITLETIDLTHLSEMESRQKSVELITQSATKTFDLSRLPLIRVVLVLLSDESAVLLLSIHHIVSDGWSMNIFLEEMSCFYQSFIFGKPSSLKPLSIQYLDYALWQRDRLSGE
ncbi:MAG: amino acid adenylation protein, partial [bacterium]